MVWKFAGQNWFWASRKEQIWSNTYSMCLVQWRSIFKRAQLASLQVCLGAGGLAGWGWGQKKKKNPLFCLSVPINKRFSSSSVGEANGLNCIQLSVKLLMGTSDLWSWRTPSFGPWGRCLWNSSRGEGRHTHARAVSVSRFKAMCPKLKRCFDVVVPDNPTGLF